MNKIFVVAMVILLVIPAFPAIPARAASEVWELAETILTPASGSLEYTLGTPLEAGASRSLQNMDGYRKQTATLTGTKMDISEYYEQWESSGDWVSYSVTSAFEFVVPKNITPGETVTFKVTGTIGSKGRLPEEIRQFGNKIEISGSIFEGESFLYIADGKEKISVTGSPPGPITKTGSVSYKVPEGEPGEEIHIFMYGPSLGSTSLKIEWIYRSGSQQIMTAAASAATASKPAVSPFAAESELPDWVKQGQMHVDEFGAAVYVPDWLEWIKPKRVSKPRGMVMPSGSGGEIFVYDRAFRTWRGPLKSDRKLMSGDIVQTGPDTSARVSFSDGYDEHTFSVSSDTLLEVPSYRVDSKWPTLWTLYEGMVKIKRGIFREVPVQVEPSPFIIHTPTLVAGTRDWHERVPVPLDRDGNMFELSPIYMAGASSSSWQSSAKPGDIEDELVVTADFLLDYDRATRTSTVYLVSGELDYYNKAAAGPDDAVLTAGQKLTVTEDGVESVVSFTASELSSLMAGNKLKEPVPLEIEEIEALLDKAESGESGGSPLWWIIIAVAVIGLPGVLVVIKKAKKTK